MRERPTLRNIRLEDLRRLSHVKILYAQATAEQWLAQSEANLRNFVAAAARATRVDGDAIRIFVGIVRRGLWHHLSIEDENRATRALKREAERLAQTTSRGVTPAEESEAQKGKEMLRTAFDLAMQGKAWGDRQSGAGKGLLIKQKNRLF